MRQPIFESHDTDVNGNPTGGLTQGTGISIAWQNGPLGRGNDRKEPNGAFTEGVIQAAIGRLEFYQNSKFACATNAKALDYLYLALEQLDSRTRERESRQVEGLHEA